MQVLASRSGLPLFQKHQPSTELRDWLNWSCCSKYRPWCGWDLCRASWESVPNKIPVNDLNIPNQHFGKLTLQVWYNVFAIIGFFRLFLPSEMRQNWLSWTLEGSFFIEVQAINWNSLGLLAVESGGVLPKFKHPVAFLVWFWILFLTVMLLLACIPLSLCEWFLNKI